MNKWQEIEKIAEVMCPNPHSCEVCDFECKPCGHQETAMQLVNAGYGNVKQAVKEFADMLKEEMELNGYRSPLHNHIIDDLITELYGADE